MLFLIGMKIGNVEPQLIILLYKIFRKWGGYICSIKVFMYGKSFDEFYFDIKLLILILFLY